MHKMILPFEGGSGQNEGWYCMQNQQLEIENERKIPLQKMTKRFFSALL
jgi:hypothetical protein